MSTYLILLAFPVIALLTIALLWAPHRVKTQKDGRSPKDTRVAPQPISLGGTDMEFLETISWEGNIAPRAASKTLPPSFSPAGQVRRSDAAADRLAGTGPVERGGITRTLLMEFPAAPTMIGQVGDDGPLLQTIAIQGDAAPRTKPTSAPASRDSAFTTSTRRDSATARLVGARLLDLSGAHGKRSFPIPLTGVTIGRDPYVSEIVLANPRISARHAWIGFVGGDAVIRDMHSTNGTLVNGRPTSSDTETVLRSGDAIVFANCPSEQFRFVMEGVTAS